MRLILNDIPKRMIEMKEPDDKCMIFMNDNLNRFLGISDKPNKILHVFSFSKSRDTYIDADFKPNVNIFTPKSIIVACDIVQDTIFAGERLKLL